MNNIPSDDVLLNDVPLDDVPLDDVLNISETQNYVLTFRKKDFICLKCKHHKVDKNNIILPDCKYKCLEELFILNITNDVKFIIKEQNNNNFVLIKSEIKINNNINTNKLSINTPYGTLFLIKSNYIEENYNNCDFGKTVCVILPAHGDFNCSCKQCSISRLVNEYKNKGYDVEKFIDKQ